MKTFSMGVMVVVLVFTSNVVATVVSFDMTLAWDGASPGGATPWLNATFDDQGTAGDVILTITATNLTSTEKVKDWYFNLDPTLDPDLLSFSSPPSKSGSGAAPWFDDPVISKGSNGFKAGSDGWFDLLIEFAVANVNETQNFDAGDSVEYTISGISSLTANSFDFMSSPGDSHGPYVTAAHVLGIGEDDSGWVTIPEPATLCLFGLGGLLLRRGKNA